MANSVSVGLIEGSLSSGLGRDGVPRSGVPRGGGLGGGGPAFGLGGRGSEGARSLGTEVRAVAPATAGFLERAVPGAQRAGPCHPCWPAWRREAGPWAWRVRQRPLYWSAWQRRANPRGCQVGRSPLCRSALRRGRPSGLFRVGCSGQGRIGEGLQRQQRGGEFSLFGGSVGCKGPGQGKLVLVF